VGVLKGSFKRKTRYEKCGMSQQGGRLALHVISMHERKEKG
jgi:hypothetical protein